MFDILGIPCNQFGLQEPGKNYEILNGIRFVRPGNHYIPKFKLTQKYNVNGQEPGKEELEVYTFMKVTDTVTLYHLSMVSTSYPCFVIF